MNHRVLFFLSIIVIGVGVVGIFIQSRQPDVVTTIEELKGNSDNAEKNILVAEALRDLQARDILSPQDYRILTLKTNGTDARDITALSDGDIRGYLVMNNVVKGGYLTPPMLLSPTDKDFSSQSLNVGEMPYSFPVKSADSYLLSSISAGDTLSLYIRLKEIEKGKTETVGLSNSEGSSSFGRKTPKYTITRIFERITVLESKRYKEQNQNESRLSQDNKTIGVIVFRLNQSQLAKLRTIENVGDLFLLPYSPTQEGINRISMDESLPQLHSIK